MSEMKKVLRTGQGQKCPPTGGGTEMEGEEKGNWFMGGKREHTNSPKRKLGGQTQ